MTVGVSGNKPIVRSPFRNHKDAFASLHLLAGAEQVLPVREEAPTGDVGDDGGRVGDMIFRHISFSSYDLLLFGGHGGGEEQKVSRNRSTLGRGFGETRPPRPPRPPARFFRGDHAMGWMGAVRSEK